MKAVFFTHWQADLKLAGNDKDLYVAMTPKCAHELEARGIDYRIPEDYCSLKEQLEQSDLFFADFEKWIARLDSDLKSLLKDAVPEGASPVKPFAYHLLNIVDPWFNQSFVLDKVFGRIKALGADSVEWVGSTKDIRLTQMENFFPYWLGESHAPAFCRELSEKHGMKLTYIDVPLRSNSNNAANGTRSSLLGSACGHLKSFLRAASDRYLLGGKGREARTIYLFGDQIPARLAASLTKRGFVKQVLDMGKALPVQIVVDRELIRRSFEIFDERNRAKVSNYIVESITHYLSRSIGAMSGIFADLDKKDIKEDGILINQYFSTFPYNCVNEYFRTRKIHRAVLFHGDMFYYHNSMKVSEIPYADTYIVTNSIVKNSFEGLYGRAKYMVTDVRYSKLPVKVKRAGSAGRKKILYLTTTFSGAMTRFFKSAVDYPPAWYFKFQKALLDKLLSTGHEIIYKPFPFDTSENPFVGMNDRHENLTVFNRRFTDSFGTFDLMLADYPSTGLLECMYAGIPCASIYPEELPIMEDAAHLSGKVLFPFRDLKEIPGLVDKVCGMKNDELLRPVEGLFPSSDFAKEKADKDVAEYLYEA